MIDLTIIGNSDDEFVVFGCSGGHLTAEKAKATAVGDLIEIEGDDQFRVLKEENGIRVGCISAIPVVKIQAGNESVCVVLDYAPRNVAGCWSIGLMPRGVGVPIPDWLVSIKLVGDEGGYSPEMKLRVPDSVQISIL